MEDKALKLARTCIEAWERGCEPDQYGPDIDEALAAIADAERQEHAEQMSLKGWQYFECPACGSQGARGFPKPAQPPDDPQALKEATHIAEWLWKNFYRDQAPEWGVLPDLVGVLSQIDNMVAGFRDLHRSEREGWRYADELLALLKRYRTETPLGHQPHMLAHEVDEAIAKATGGAV